MIARSEIPLADIAIEARRRIDSGELREYLPRPINGYNETHTVADLAAIAAMHRYEAATQTLRDALQCCGQRHANSTFESYVVSTPAQRIVLDGVRSYVHSGRAASGGGLLLCGPRGTGKDHLLVAAARECVHWHGTIVAWRSGIDLIEHLVDIMYGRAEWSEYDNAHHYSDLLILSDPLPPSAELSPTEQRAIFSLVDHRYRHRRATWISANVAKEGDLDHRIGPAIADRLRDGATHYACHWPSYRRLAT